jgi:hypothetical protein
MTPAEMETHLHLIAHLLDQAQEAIEGSVHDKTPELIFLLGEVEGRIGSANWIVHLLTMATKGRSCTETVPESENKKLSP